MIRTGIEEFDRLAKDAPAELQKFLDGVRAHGWIVKATDKLPTGVIAYFLPRKGRFYYHPGRMSILDMWHEAKHLELFERRGNRKTAAGQRARDEMEVYQFEYELGEQHGFSKAYMVYLDRRIADHREQLEGPEAPRLSRMPDPFMKQSEPPD
jgi:hypothetical protein